LQTETAITQNRGLIALCERGLSDLLAKAPEQRAEVERAAARAAASLNELQSFFEHELLPRSDGDFRLGRRRFEQQLRLTLDDPVDAEQFAASARKSLIETQAEMFETSRELWPSLISEPMPPATTPAERHAVVRRVLDKLAEDRPSNATIVGDAEQLLAETTKFVRAHDLVTIPEEPCRVIEMPEYRRGVSIAYCDASGPLEKTQQTFYAISPTPHDWPPARVESFYREYNRSMLADLTVHEAMPGHFLQLMHNNRFPSKIRAVFSSGAFVEGWAVYSEWLMSKYGFGGAKVRLLRQKMVLRLCVNALLDYGVHAGQMQEKEALELMMNEAFQEEGEATGKWRRAQLTSTQLSTYYYGYIEMMKLRALAEARPGFVEREYHDRLLSFGSPPPRYLRAAMGL
jgi:hypothetical protein